MKNYRVVIHIKNHNLCISIILILSFLLMSHIFKEESDVYLKIAATRLPSETEARPEAPLPRARGQSIMFDN